MSRRFRRVARALVNLEGDFSLDVASPEFCLHLLVNPNLKTLTRLHRKLRILSKEWVIEFIELGGLLSLLKCVDQFYRSRTSEQFFNSLVLSKTVCCIKELLNLKYGMECVINLANENRASVRMLALGIFIFPNQSLIPLIVIFPIFELV